MGRIEGSASSSSPTELILAPSPGVNEIPTAANEDETVENIVMSEVHLGCPPNTSGPHISRFTFSLPVVNDEQACNQVILDEDGDLVVARRSRPFKDTYVVTIQHNITSSIPSVGLQVWRAEMVLADFVLHTMVTTSELNGIVALELGAGTGLVGLLLARVAKTVFLTDRGDEVLDNCADNVWLNSGMFCAPSVVQVREIDWKESWPSKLEEDRRSCKRYAWTSADLDELQRVSLIVAADVIYSDDLTDALFSTLERIMTYGAEKVLYLALEKRYNFSLDDLNVVANGYARFRSYIRVGENDDLGQKNPPCFVGHCIDVSEIPKYIREYDRGNDVELWHIKYEKQKKLPR